MKKVGIILLNFNGSEYLFYTLDSLKRAKTSCPFAVGVIDNSSAAEDAEKAERITKDFLAEGFEGFFIRSEKNLGFSGGNNVVMRRFMEDPSITHLCMLNSDVLVTDYWLDYLTEQDHDAVGPVTNATGNEQTVAVDYEVKLDRDAFDVVNRFAAYRHETFTDVVFETEILYFFNTILARRVVETIGYLDERFYPGSFEDGDFCLRMKNAGFHQQIVRGCFVHHFGSGSFSKLDMPDRVNITNVNRKRFEDKWHIKWESDTWKILLSCQQDLSAFRKRPMDERTGALMDKALGSTETLIKNWAAGIEWFQSDGYIEQRILERQREREAAQVQAPQSQEEASQETVTPPPALPNVLPSRYTEITELNGTTLVKLFFIKLRMRFYQLIGSPRHQEWENRCLTMPGYSYPLVPLRMTSGKEMLARAFQLLLVKLKLKKPQEPIRVSPTPEQVDLEEEITARLSQTKDRIVVHAPVFTAENERDGYIQRIKRVDEAIFAGFVRLYVLEDGKRAPTLALEKLDDTLYFVRYNSHDPEQREKIFRWVRLCGQQYIHSINRFMTDSVDVEMCQLLPLEGVKTFWDVHGSVPEEYAMYGSEVGCQIGNEVERFFMQYADVIVVVNHATERHLLEKHGPTKAKFVVLPIFNLGSYTSVEVPEKKQRLDGKHTVVYCGGVQKWQNVDLMCEIMEKTGDKCAYLVMTPKPEDFNAYWHHEMPSDVTVVSKAPEELAEMYRDQEYGFLLRDDDVVNRVACPTKILEYIAYGIVPVLKSPRIGDFLDMGLHYVQYEDILGDKMPDENQRLEYAQENIEIFGKLAAAFETGTRELRSLVREEQAQPQPEPERVSDQALSRTVLSRAIQTAKPGKRILVTTENFAGGGLETHIYSYYLQLREEHSFSFAVGTMKSKLPFEGNCVHTGFHFSPGSTVAEFVEDVERLVTLIREEKIHVIHAHPFYSFYPAVIASQLTGVPLVCTYHGIASFSFSQRLVDTILFQYFYEELVSKIFTVSETGRRAVSRRMHINNVSFLPNAVDISQYSQHTVQSNGCWAAISRLDADNGKESALKKLFDILPQLHIQRIDVFGDGTRREALEDYVREKGLSSKVRFMGFRDDLSTFLNGKYNGIIGTDRVAIEGLVMGYPVLELGYGRINGLIDSELLAMARDTNFDANLLPSVNDPQRLNQQLEKLSQRPEDYIFRKEMQRDFDIAVVAGKYMQELEGLPFYPHANVVEFYDAVRSLYQQQEAFYASQAVFGVMRQYIEYYAVIPSVKLLFLLGAEDIDLRNTIAWLQDHGGFAPPPAALEEVHTPKSDFLKLYNKIRSFFKRLFR